MTDACFLGKSSIYLWLKYLGARRKTTNFSLVKRKHLTTSAQSCMITQVMEMERIVQQGLLYDFYGELLTEHQRHVYEEVVFHDLSLSEIAEEQGISRQGVHDLIKRCDRILMEYERKLRLVEKFRSTKELAEKIQDLLDAYEQKEDRAVLGQIRQIVGKIKEI